MPFRLTNVDPDAHAADCDRLVEPTIKDVGRYMFRLVHRCRCGAVLRVDAHLWQRKLFGLGDGAVDAARRIYRDAPIRIRVVVALALVRRFGRMVGI
jgi:hypothetical protein